MPRPIAFPICARIGRGDGRCSQLEAFAAARIAALKVGPAADPASQIGPMINARAVEKILRHIDDAVDIAQWRWSTVLNLPAAGEKPGSLRTGDLGNEAPHGW